MSEILSVTGPKAGVRYRLALGTTVVGRSSQCEIQLVDEAVSRRHARFERTATGVTICDLHSENGTLLNGVGGQDARALRPSDVVAIGATTFVFEPSLDYLIGPSTDVIVAHEASPSAALARPVLGNEQSAEANVAATVVLDALCDTEVARGAVDLVTPVLRAVAEQLGAQRAFVARVTEGSLDQPRVIAGFGPGPITVSRTVLKEVLRGPSALISQDAAADTVLRSGVSLQIGGIRSLMAAPLIQSGRVLGIVHVDRAEAGAYQDSDLERLLPHARMLGLVLLAQEGLAQRRVRASTVHRIEAPDPVAVAPSTRRLLLEAQKAASSSAHVLIYGATGTGKEVVARVVHTAGDRGRGPFVAVNCGALPEALEESALFGHCKGAFTGADRDSPGLFEAAAGGTLFLDEVGETSRATQVKLLRVLQERVLTRVGETKIRPVVVRVISATHRNLEARILEGAFRQDLYYRLAVIQLTVPALSARTEDILPLARRFTAEIAQTGGCPVPTLSVDLEEALLAYGWPGNVRELRNIMERMVIMGEGPQLVVGDLPLEVLSGAAAAQKAVAQGDTLAEAVARLEREMIVRTMARTGGVKLAAAEALGISRVTLDTKIRNHKIEWKR